LISIPRSYRHKQSVLFFDSHCRQKFGSYFVSITITG